MEHLEPRYALTVDAVSDHVDVVYQDEAQTNGLFVLFNDSSETTPTITEFSSPAHGTLTLDPGLTFFQFTPEDGFTGQDSFTYTISDGASSDAATVTIQVRPQTGIGDAVTSSIVEGSGLHLDDLNHEPISKTIAPGTVRYYWYLDVNPDNVDPSQVNYVPPANALLSPEIGSLESTLDVTWGELNDVGIVNGQLHSAILTLKIVDGRGQEAIASQSLGIFDLEPQVTAFEIMPISTSGSGCEGGETSYAISATFVEANPLETEFQVFIEWDFFGVREPLTYVDNNDGTFTVSATLPHTYSSGEHVPSLKIEGYDEIGPSFGWFLTSAGGNPLFGIPAITTGSIGEERSFNGPAGKDTYAWAVTKDGASFNPGTPTDQETFSFTPAASGMYALTLTTTFFNGEGTETQIYDHVAFVTGGGAATPPVVAIGGAPASSGEGTAISLTSTVTQACGAELAYAWSVTKNGNPYATGTATGGPSFDFTPDDNGTYLVSLAATGDGGATIASESIVVTNLAPAITHLNLTQVVGGGPAVALAGSFTDPGTADTFTVQIVWESGVIDNIAVDDAPSGAHTFAINHTYTTTGDKPISVTVIDDEEEESAAGAASASIHAALAADGTLGIAGTSAADTVMISTPTSGTVRVQGSMLGSAIDFAAASVTGMVVKLGAGNDILINTTTKAMIAAGGTGTDIITDAGGRGILIGGAGSDVLSGGGGQDILIDSGSDHDNDDAALLALLAYWNSGDALTTRVNNLLAGNGVPELNGDTIDDDGDFDLLIGGGGIDWVLLHSEDLSLGFGDILEDVEDL